MTSPAVEERDRPCVLIVEDDPPLRTLMQLTLQREDLVTAAAADGIEAIERLESATFRVVLLDLMMPRMNGWEVIDWLRDHPSKLPRTVVVVTAADRSVFARLDPDVVNAIIVKPFDIYELAGYVCRCCETPVERDRRSKRVIGEA